MVTTEFKNKATQGYDEVHNAPETGNAFASGQMKRETINALQNAMMNADADDSSITTAAMKLSGHFKSSASKRDDKKDKGLSMGEMSLLQQVNDYIRDLDEIILDTKERLELSEMLIEAIKNDTFDPLNNEAHREAVVALGYDPDEFSELPKQEQLKIMEEVNANDEAMLNAAESRRTLIANNPSMLTVENGEFTDPAMEEIRSRVESKGRAIDPENMTVEDRQEFIEEMMVDNTVLQRQADVQTALNENSKVEETLDSFF